MYLVGGTPGSWRDLIEALDRADLAHADSELRVRPETAPPRTARPYVKREIFDD